MRIIIELSPAETDAREQWQNYDDEHADNIDVYDARWKRLADAAMSAAREIAASVDLRRRELFDHAPPALLVEGVDLGYAVGPSFARGAQMGDTVVHVRYTLAGTDRSVLPQRKGRDKETITRIRAKIAGRKEPCGDNCPGWAVFNADTDPLLERCDECWYGHPDPLTDDEIDELPEAAHELALAVEDGDGYDQPDLGAPCACGCKVWRLTDGQTHEQCSACGRTRTRCPERCACERCRPELYVK